MSGLEHVNITVTDPKATAEMLGDLFGWRVRWEGSAINNGFTMHVGTDDAYVAIYTPPGDATAGPSSYETRGGLNHVGVVVDDLDATEARVKARGLVPEKHADYEPGRRFYFRDGDGIEWEVVSYA